MDDPGKLAASVIGMRKGRHLVLLLDFDGTLCEFEPDPAAVRLKPVRRDLLSALTVHATVGIVSGRRLDDVRERAAIEPLVVAGMHGLEIDALGERFVHPDLAKARVAIAGATRDLVGIAAPLAGVFVEEKGASVAFHFRHADCGAQRAAIDGFGAVAEAYLKSGQLRLMRGSFVLELLPNIPWNKGHAVRWIQQRVERLMGSSFVVYVGDDVTDADAFAAIAADGLPVTASDRVTANARLDGPAALEQFLRFLVSCLNDRDAQR